MLNILDFSPQFWDLCAVMHDLRLIHTDLKPENVLLVSPEYLKVPDYKVLSPVLWFSCVWWSSLLLQNIEWLTHHYDVCRAHLGHQGTAPTLKGSLNRVPLKWLILVARHTNVRTRRTLCQHGIIGLLRSFLVRKLLLCFIFCKLSENGCNSRWCAGLGWSYPCDVWSVGCILVELCTVWVTFKAILVTHHDDKRFDTHGFCWLA